MGHTKGIAQIIDDFGQTDEHPCCYIEINGKIYFQTIYDNDKANANRLVLCWNEHDGAIERANLAEAALVKFEQLAAEANARLIAAAPELLEVAKKTSELLAKVAEMNIQPFPFMAVALNNEARQAVEKAKPSPEKEKDNG